MVVGGFRSFHVLVPFFTVPWTCNRAHVRTRLGLIRVKSLSAFGEIRT